MKILIVLTSHDQLGDTGEKTGFWLEEFAAPYYLLKDAGAALTLASPKGGQPPLDPKSDLPENQTELTKRFSSDTAVLVAAVVLLLTVENAFNRIWQVKKDRPLLKRVGMYLLILALGPLVLGASLWATSYLLGASAGLLRALPPSAAYVLQLGPVLLGTVALASLFYFLPNTRVRRRDAIVGGLLGSIALELGKRGFAAYLLSVPTYKTIYGGFAVVPVFLLWVYFSWLITLAAALVAANLGRRWRTAAPARRRAGLA